MVSPTTRRAFLLGRRTPASQWGTFCARLSRTCTGTVRWEDQPGRQQAWLVPAREEDVLHAHALCRQYAVQLMLDGVQSCNSPDKTTTPRLWVESGRAWARLTACDAHNLVWRADAGCKIKLLQDQGIQTLSGADPEQTVAQWLASPDSAQWPTGQGVNSGIEQVQVMLADGTQAWLGPFGANATTPLRSLTVQKMIPRLFELAHSSVASDCALRKVWPLRFRLDALLPGQGSDINLAWLMAGHQARLGWTQAVWFRRDQHPSASRITDRSDLPALNTLLCEGLEQELKLSFDPIGIFP